MLLFTTIFFAVAGLVLTAFIDWLENESNKLNERNERTNNLKERVINFFMNE